MILFKRKTKDKEKKTDKPVEEVEVGSGGGSVAMPKGDDADAYRIVMWPRITEKGSMMGSPSSSLGSRKLGLGKENKYVFRVAKNANKLEIKKAVGQLYKVEVAKVNILKTPSKHRRVGRYEGRKSGFKKAIVTLREGSKIDTAV